MIKIKDTINRGLLFVLPIAGGFLGALGGADKSSKSYRRFVIPALLTSYAYSNTESVLSLVLMLMSIGLSLGYGIPDATDEGSGLGRFFYRIFNHNNTLTNVFTRGTVGLIIAVPLVVIPIMKHNWLIFVAGVVAIILTNALISWRGFGTYKLLGKELSWVETVTWGLITLFSSVIIHIGGHLR